jgi:hypothetical protein
MRIRKMQMSQIDLGRRFGGRRLGGQLLAGLIVVANLAATAQAAEAAKPFNRPLLFEPNRGQAVREVKWLARGPGYQLFFTSDAVTIALPERAAAPARSASQRPESLLPRLPFPSPAESPISVFRMKLTGSHAWNTADGLESTGSTSNYYIGNDPKQWRTDIPNYARLKEKGVYDGIDLVFHSRGDQLEYDFEVAPGADPRQIRLAFDGLDHMHVDDQTGDLLLTTASGTVARQIRPKIYQQIGERRVEVAGGYEILDHGQITFALASYDRRQPLVIDPSVVFTVLLAGESWDSVGGIAVDSSGNAYIAGSTQSVHFPLVIVKWEPGWGSVHGDATAGDAFVTKLSPTGAILFSAYFGGTSSDGASAIALGSTGVYITGTTLSNDFPLRGPFMGRRGLIDIFVAKISLTGNEYLYSSYLGGSGSDYARAIAVDPSGAAYIVGFTQSTDFPRAGPRPSQFNGGGEDGFLTKVAPQGDHLVYSGYLGGNGSDVATCVAVDQNGFAYVAGGTSSTDLPVTPGLQTFPVGYITGFVLSMEPGGTIRFLRYLGGDKSDVQPVYAAQEFVSAITVDANSNIYLAGVTKSSKFPVSQSGFLFIKPSPSGFYTGFVVSLDAALQPRWGTYFGSNDGDDYLYSIAVNGAGDVYLGGSTTSGGIPGLPWLPRPNPTAGFVAKLTNSVHILSYAMRLGASVNGIGTFVSNQSAPFEPPGPHQQVYCTGIQYTDGPTDSTDVFVVKLDEGVSVVKGPPIF